MTRESRQLISVDEILAVRLTCSSKGCGASISLPVSKLSQFPRKCPISQDHQWAVQNGATERILKDLQNCLNFLIDAEREQKDKHKAKRKEGDDDYLGFSLRMEIRSGDDNEPTQNEG
jgi:hypothetical protein